MTLKPIGSAAQGTMSGQHIDRSLITRAWGDRGFSCDLWVDPPGQAWEEYRHSVDELLMVIEGHLEVEMQGTRHWPQPGEEILILGGVVHSVRNIGGTTARLLYGYKER